MPVSEEEQFLKYFETRIEAVKQSVNNTKREQYVFVMPSLPITRVLTKEEIDKL